MHTRKGIAHFDDGGRTRSEDAERQRRAAVVAAAEAKKKADWAAADAALLKQYNGKVPLNVAIDRATALRQENYTPRQGGRDGSPEKWGVTDSQAVNQTFSALGLDPALAPKNVDLGFYNKLQSLAGGKLDPKGALAAATYYDDGRSKANEEKIPELVAQGVFQGKTGAELWKPVEAWNDSQRGKKQGWGAVENFATGFAQSVSENPLAQMAISAAAGAMGVPPNVTMAFLAANDVGQGKKIEDVAKNIAMQYAGGKLGEMAGGAAKTATAGMDLGKGVTSGITNAASGAAKGALNAAVSGGDILAGGLKGGISGLSSAAGSAAGGATGNQFVGDLAKIGTTAALSGKGVNANSLINAGVGALGRTDAFGDMSDSISAQFKDLGLDSLDLGGLKIPGDFNAKGNIVPGISATDALKVAGAVPALKPIVGAVNTARGIAKNPISGIAALANPAQGNRRPPPPARRPPPPPAARPTPTGTRPPIGGVKKPIPPGG